MGSTVVLVCITRIWSLFVFLEIVHLEVDHILDQNLVPKHTVFLLTQPHPLWS